MPVAIALAAMLLSSPAEDRAGLSIASGMFVIENRTDEPLCVAASVATDGIHTAAFDLLTAAGEVQPVFRLQSTVASVPAVATSWLIIAPHGTFTFESSLMLPGQAAGDSTVTAARLSYWSLPCDFVLETYVRLDPDVDDEASLSIRDRADRLVNFGTTEWAEIFRN